MSNFDQQLKKGVLELLILSMISEKDMYGYELICEIENKSRGLIYLKEGSLYPILYRLEDYGYVTVYEVKKEGSKQSKKYYSITDDGKKQLNEWYETWDFFTKTIYSMLRSDKSE